MTFIVDKLANVFFNETVVGMSPFLLFNFCSPIIGYTLPKNMPSLTLFFSILLDFTFIFHFPLYPLYIFIVLPTLFFGAGF
jgi:hypothetical protein